ncbi:MAG: ECF transporter S component [Oscillospiraceae bacterium]|jgi:uncharacterized membrane protein|nr:ECF transporter S component [Oscillospiraceae bacterium]
MQKKVLTIKLSIAGLMTALIFIFINIRIPLSTHHQMIHMGDIFCVIAGLILNPALGGLCAGLGCFIFDILNPMFISSAPFTFLFKFLMTFICSVIAHKIKNKCSNYTGNSIAAIVGVFVYIVLRSIKAFIYNFFILQIPLQSVLILVGKVILVSSINGVLTVLVAVPLADIIIKALMKNKLYEFIEN